MSLFKIADSEKKGKRMERFGLPAVDQAIKVSIKKTVFRYTYPFIFFSVAYYRIEKKGLVIKITKSKDLP